MSPWLIVEWAGALALTALILAVGAALTWAVLQSLIEYTHNKKRAKGGDNDSPQE